jgi:hypothetical protein
MVQTRASSALNTHARNRYILLGDQRETRISETILTESGGDVPGSVSDQKPIGFDSVGVFPRICDNHSSETNQCSA